MPIAARHGVGFGGDAEQVQVELFRNRLEGRQVHQWCEGVEDTDRDVLALEADRVGNPVAVDAHVDDRGVDQFDVDFGVAGFPSQLLADLVEGLPLHFVDDVLKLRQVNLGVGARAFVVDGGGSPFDQLPGDAHHHLLRHYPSLLLSTLKRGLAVFDHAADVGNGAVLHIAQALALPAVAAHDRLGPVDFANQRLDELGADVQRDEVIRERGVGADQAADFFKQSHWCFLSLLQR
ncbi:MAG: hypothetical protein WKG07_13250 [Hymenobacter sp.]